MVSFVLAAFAYVIGVLLVMIASIPGDYRRAREQRGELERMGVRCLWPFGSVSDVRTALERRASEPLE